VNKPASTTYHGNYVAIVEPPETTGKAVARPETADRQYPARSTGRRVGHCPRETACISDPKVVEMTRKYDLARAFKAYELPETSLSANLERAHALTPMLVNAKRAAYYLVPLTFEGSAASGQAQAAVAINATTAHCRNWGCSGQ